MNKKQINDLLEEAEKTSKNTYLKSKKDTHPIRINMVREHNNKLEVLIVSYQGSVWIDVLPTDVIYNN